MKLERLEIRNFRQFYGRQTLEFSQHAEQNVTVIHGSNGSGKTTLLNAFLWLFYEKITLPKAEKIASERALAQASPGEAVEVEVTLEFTHEEREYTARRSKSVRLESPTDLTTTEINSEAHLEFINEDGNRKVRGNANDALKQILPQRLREIFFFDGETIDELSAIGGQDKIQTAIQNIMGLTILERAKRHLDAVRKRFEEEVSEHGSEELSSLYDERNKLEERKDTLGDELSNVRDSKRKAQEESTDVNRRLEELEDSRDLQQTRNRLRDEIADLERQIEAVNEDIAKRINEGGHVPFAAPAVEETAKMLKKKRDKGEIPSEIKTQFVDDLLEMGECICGRDIRPETAPYQSVKQWRQQAGSSEIEEAAMNIVGRLTELAEEEEQIYDDIEGLLGERTSLGDERQQKEERIAEISNQLVEAETEDVNELEKRRKKLSNKITKFDKQIGKMEGNIERLEDQLKEMQEEIAKAEEKNEKADLAARRAQMAEYLKTRVDSLFERYQDEVRKSVNERVNGIFKEIIVKDYYAEISQDYSLRILKDVGERETISVAKSTGERQVASLAFIASLVSLARERYNSDEEAIYFSGGIYPMIMDSPFGYLDPEYQKRVSAMLPEMAEQVVVLVTQSQWSDAVAGEMDVVAGERYYLEYHDPADESETDYEYTEIVQKHGGIA